MWSAASGWSAAAQSAALRLRAAPEDGLDLRAFAIPATDSRGAPTRADELALSEAVAAYVWQASGGRIDPARKGQLLVAVTERHTRGDLDRLVRALADFS